MLQPEGDLSIWRFQFFSWQEVPFKTVIIITFGLDCNVAIFVVVLMVVVLMIVVAGVVVVVVVPDAGALQRLPRRIPYNIAMEMFFLGRRMSAQEAKSFGLVNKVVDKSSLLDSAREWAEKMAQSAPLAMQSV